MSIKPHIVNLNTALRAKTDVEIEQRLEDLQARRTNGALRIAALRRTSPEQFNPISPVESALALKERLLSALETMSVRTDQPPAAPDKAAVKARAKQAKAV